MSVLNNPRAWTRIAIVVVCVFFPSVSVCAQPTSALSSADTARPDGPVMVLLQGEELRVAEDFVAKLEGNKLRLALLSNGVIQPPPAETLVARLIRQDGSVSEQPLRANGEFVFENVKEGLAALVVTASGVAATSRKAAYAAMTFFVQAPVIPAGEQVRPFQVPIGIVEPERLSRDLSSDSEDDEPPAKTEDILTFDRFKGTRAFKTSGASRFRVQRQPDGSVQGRVVVPQRGYEVKPGVTSLVFYHDDVLVASAYSTPEGDFIVRNLPVGFNTVVATGPSGHTAYSLEVVANPQAGELIRPESARNQKAQTKLVATEEDAESTLIVVLIPPAMMPQVREIVRSSFGTGEQPSAGATVGFPPLMPAGMASGGGAGGGSGGAGGGGAFAVGGLAAIAAAVVALDDDDDGFNVPIATPIAP